MVDTDPGNHLLPPMAWDGWGDPELAKPLSAGIRSLLAQALGVTATEIAAPGISEVQLSPSVLGDNNRNGLAAIVGNDYLRTGDHDRLQLSLYSFPVYSAELRNVVIRAKCHSPANSSKYLANI